ncbi:hypothetical protein [Clostridium senegalense]|uniref:hypothetical protein n=1 Tax=Clostridium senegalense TaxID=1465809 RepID=UPI001C101439|nr:hypothetical protein [Clostridium senegalense]MBU5226558.1 hypothetical protein [Clostridium senegalense]
METNKTDKGFELLYYKLSYRRKFLRTLWMTPFLIVCLAIIWLANDNIILDTIFTIFCVSIYLLQLVFTYFKWKKDEQS